ncbi:MAG: hypothetical protein ACOYON_00985 [Fimbriimonas sp.]
MVSSLRVSGIAIILACTTLASASYTHFLTVHGSVTETISYVDNVEVSGPFAGEFVGITTDFDYVATFRFNAGSLSAQPWANYYYWSPGDFEVEVNVIGLATATIQDADAGSAVGQVSGQDWFQISGADDDRSVTLNLQYAPSLAGPTGTFPPRSIPLCSPSESSTSPITCLPMRGEMPTSAAGTAPSTLS